MGPSRVARGPSDEFVSDSRRQQHRSCSAPALISPPVYDAKMSLFGSTSTWGQNNNNNQQQQGAGGFGTGGFGSTTNTGGASGSGAIQGLVSHYFILPRCQASAPSGNLSNPSSPLRTPCLEALVARRQRIRRIQGEALVRVECSWSPTRGLRRDRRLWRDSERGHVCLWREAGRVWRVWRRDAGWLLV